MSMSKRLAITALALALAGCSSFGRRSSAEPAPAAASAAPAVAASTTTPNPTYYKLTDVASGKTFYTQKVNRSGTAVVFTDEKTGAETSLQSWQVLPVQKMEYTSGIAPDPAVAAPVPVGK